MILPIHTYGARVLRSKAKPVQKMDESVMTLIVNMFDTMHSASGIGLAANQVGTLRRVIVVDISDVEEKPDAQEHQPLFKSHPPVALINPEVVASEGSWQLEEGCLSIPGVRDIVERAERIKVRYKDASFRDTELEADGLLARVILHEIDHLNGVLFPDHVPAQKRKTHKEALKKIQRGEFEVDYPVAGAGVRVAAD